MPGLRSIMATCLAIVFGLAAVSAEAQSPIQLPPPSLKGKTSVEAAIVAKKSIRSFKGTPLSLKQVSQLLWAANGQIPADAITGATSRVIPSAGGLYALEVFLVSGAGTVKGLTEGVYRYQYHNNSLTLTVAGDKRNLLAHAALGQTWLARAPALIVIAAVFERSTVKYGQRGVNYVFMEAGSSDQNIYLQSVALGLNTGTVGAFNDPQVSAVLGLPQQVKPILIVAVGK